MRYSTASVMVMAALSIGEAVAGPAHAHLHRKLHEKKSVDWAAFDWNNMGIDWSSAWAAGQHSSTASAAVAQPTTAAAATTTKAAVVAAATTSATAKASTSASSVTSSSVSSGLATLWNDLVGIANEFTEFGAATVASGSEVSKIGNIGKKQGSNIIKVSSREGYAYTNEFINTSGKSMTVVIWNKAYSTTGNAADALANLGASVAPKTPILTFALAAGASQIVAFQENSQVGWAQATSDIAESGAFATTWGEANFCSTGSGYDMSAIMNKNGNNYNMAISSTEASCISDMTQNYWLTDTQPIGNSDGSCYIAQSTATLTTKMGGYVS